MACYLTHILIAKKYIECNKGLPSQINDEQAFIDGNIMPDLADNKEVSHYGIRMEKENMAKRCQEKVNPQRFINEHGIHNEQDLGWYLHLLVDDIYYNKFLNHYISGVSYREGERVLSFLTERESEYLLSKYDVSLDDSTHKKRLKELTKEWQEIIFNKYGKDDGEAVPYTFEELEVFINQMANVKIANLIN